MMLIYYETHLSVVLSQQLPKDVLVLPHWITLEFLKSSPISCWLTSYGLMSDAFIIHLFVKSKLHIVGSSSFSNAKGLVRTHIQWSLIYHLM